MNTPASSMQSLAMLQSALTAARPGVDEAVVMAGGQGVPAQGVGNPAGQMGNALGSMIGSGGINPTQNEVELALLGGTASIPPSYVAAQDQYLEDMAQYQNTRQRRFRGNLGGAEAIYDLVMSKKTRKDALKSRGVLDEERVKYDQNQQKQLMAAEMQRRADYVKNALPLIMYNNPELPHKAAIALATQAAAQKMPIEKLLPEGSPSPVREEYEDPTTGATMVRFRHPQNGSIMQGENWKPFMKEGPANKPDGTLKVTQTLEDGSVVENYYADKPGPDGENVLVRSFQVKPPTPDAPVLKGMESMAGEQRKMLGLVGTAAKQYADYVPTLVDASGNWDNLAPLKYGSKKRAAYQGMKSAVFDVLRSETGAAITDQEVERDVDRYLPVVSDSDLTARAKLHRLWMKLNAQHTSTTSGYRDIPPALGLPDITNIKFLADGAPEAVKAEIQRLDLDEAYVKAMRKAEEARRRQEG